MLSDNDLISKLTLAIPVYNDVKFIRETLESCINQAGQILICDNASTDGTSEICAEYARKFSHIRHIINDENIGALANFSLPLFECKTEYFQWLGSHDCLEENFTLNILRRMHQDRDAVLGFGRIKYIDENGCEVKKKQKSYYVQDMLSDDPFVRMRAMLGKLRDCFIIYGVFRADLARQVWQDVPCIGCDDAYLLRVAAIGKVVYEPESVFRARDLSETRKNIDARKRQSEALGHPKNAPVAKDMSCMIEQMIQTVTGCPQYKKDLAGGFEVLQQIYLRYLEPRKKRKARRLRKASLYMLLAALVIGAVACVIL